MLLTKPYVNLSALVRGSRNKRQIQQQYPITITADTATPMAQQVVYLPTSQPGQYGQPAPVSPRLRFGHNGYNARPVRPSAKLHSGFVPARRTILYLLYAHTGRYQYYPPSRSCHKWLYWQIASPPAQTAAPSPGNQSRAAVSVLPFSTGSEK